MDKLSKCTTILLVLCTFVFSVCAEESTQKEQPKGCVVYTVKAITARTKLTREMFRENWIPQGQIPQAAVSRIYELEGRIAQFDLPKGCLVSTPFASGLYAPKGDTDYKDPIPCIYDTSTNAWSIKEIRKTRPKTKCSIGK